MSAPVVVEVVPVDVVVTQTGLSTESAQGIGDSFAHLFSAARVVMERSRKVEVTSLEQKGEMKLARECRLEIKRLRVEADKTRKTLKEDSLRRGRAIDGFYNIFVEMTESEEKRLEEQEKFAERLEAERKAKLKADREHSLAAYKVDTRFIDLENMPQADFDAFLARSKETFEAMQVAAARAEEERQARIKAEAEERARRDEEARKLALENERLRKEAEERERIARIEREKVEAAMRAENERLAEIARVEREAREKAEAQARAAAAEEAKRIAAAEAAARKAASAPDREKLEGLVVTLRSIPLPSVASPEAYLVVEEIGRRIELLAKFLEREVATL